jgi:hypothetical protein
LLQRKGHIPEAVTETADLAVHPQAGDQELVTARRPAREQAERAPGWAQEAERDLVGGRVQVVRERGTEREQVVAAALEEEPVTARRPAREQAERAPGWAQEAERDLVGGRV